MFNQKSKIIKHKFENGFTLIELMVAITIMVVLASIMILNLAGQRSKRDITIAENQLVSDIRQAQSNTLSSRTINGQTAQYYLLKFDLSRPKQYTIQAIYNAGTAPKLIDVQTVNFPPNITFSSISPIVISGRTASPVSQTIASNGCALVAFAAPFGKVLLNNSCGIVSPPNIDTSSPSNQNDDYNKILNFVANTACDGSTPPNPAVCSVSADSVMTINLSDAARTVSRTITINGITGAVTFN